MAFLSPVKWLIKSCPARHSESHRSWQDARVTRPYEHTNPDVAWVTSFSGYLSHRLTGEFKDNIANYFGQWPVDYKTWTWSDDDESLVVQTTGKPAGKPVAFAAVSVRWPMTVPGI